MISKETLLNESRERHYKPEILEKVYRLIITLDQIMSVPYLRERLVLKGGTALNLFHFEDIPRLSVDVDLNYIGQLDRDLMLQERSVINDALNQIFHQNQFELYRNPAHHAGGKMVWRYSSLLGQKGNLEIDLNYMYRQPLFSIQQMLPKISSVTMTPIPVLDIHELAAGKLIALFSRETSRDLFDTHFLLTKCKLSLEKLRIAFVSYLAMSDIDLNNLRQDYINCNILDLRNRLLPVLRQKDLPRGKNEMLNWARQMTDELHDALLKIVPLRSAETEFIRCIRDLSDIKPELLTDDKKLMRMIQLHPAILWVIEKNTRIK